MKASLKKKKTKEPAMAARSLKEEISDSVERDRPLETKQSFNPAAQPELFEDDIISHGIMAAVTKATPSLTEKFERIGQSFGDKYSDQIMDEARVAIMRYLPEDIRAALGEQDNANEFIEEDDGYYQLTSDICRAFIRGMSQAWPHVIDAPE
jgi:hypothetical protein